MNRDTIIGVIGAAILMGAMVGILYVQGASAPKDTMYSVTWETQAGGLDAITGRAEGGTASEENVSLDVANLTNVLFTLTWTDDDPSALDAFTLLVTTPGGQTFRSTAATSGSILVNVTPEFLNSPPVPGQVAAKDQAEAEQKLAASNTRDAGRGAWTVKIQVEPRTANPSTPVPLPGAGPDTGNDWSLKVDYTTYRPVLAPST